MERYIVTIVLFAIGNLLAFAVMWGRLRGQVESNKTRIDVVHDKLDDKYLTTDKHQDICYIAQLKMREYIAETIKESESRIIDAINGKQIRWATLNALKEREEEERKNKR